MQHGNGSHIIRVIVRLVPVGLYTFPDSPFKVIRQVLGFTKPTSSRFLGL